MDFAIKATHVHVPPLMLLASIAYSIVRVLHHNKTDGCILQSDV